MAMYWKKLKVWESAHELALKIYHLTVKFPDSEKYALSNQLRRSAYSVPANIVEGHSRRTTRDYMKFLYQARGSLEELRYFLFLSKDLNYLTPESYDDLEEKSSIVSKMLNGMINSVKQKLNS
jgi:four helix bundle protein